VTLPVPVPGLVIRCSYLWANEHDAGRDEGVKDRPCAINVVVARTETSRERVIVLPVTHSPPIDPSTAIELPALTKKRLGLDDERSWIVIHEYNEFLWPGADLRRIGDGDDSTTVYGALPSRLLKTEQQRFLELFRKKTVRAVRRTE
jgi:hypothetical protein